MKPFDEYLLGISESEIALSTAEQNRDLALKMATQATRTVDIFSRDLDPRIYDNPAFVDALGSVAPSSKYSRVRILILDPDPVIKSGHRLVELARRLSSYFEIRLINEDYKRYNHAFFIVDNNGYCFRELADRYEATCNFNDALRSRQLTDLFNEAWEHSLPATQLKRLYL